MILDFDTEKIEIKPKTRSAKAEYKLVDAKWMFNMGSFGGETYISYWSNRKTGKILKNTWYNRIRIRIEEYIDMVK